MFERFTVSARDAVVGAQDVARAMGARSVGTEHLLVALLPAGSPTAASLGVTGPAVAGALDAWDDEVLAVFGIEMADLRARLLPASPKGQLPLTAGSKATLTDALRIARGLKARRLTDRHLLLALLLRTRPDPAGEVLARLGVDVAAARGRLTSDAEAEAA